VKAWLGTLAAAVAFTGLVVAAGLMPRSGSTVLVGRSESHGQVQFEVEGEPVGGLFPGGHKQIKLSVVNPFGYRLRLVSLTGRVVSTSRTGCPATSASIVVESYRGRLPVTLNARSRTKLAGSIPITMPKDATPRCSSTRFVLSFTGAGEKVSR
jgi:hypothetical protein